jgi:opacity protein-like surface antigen
MKKLFFPLAIAALALSSAFTTFGQSTDIKKVEFFGGYSYHSTDTGLDEIDSDFDSRVGAHGFETAVTGNLSRYVGIKGDLSWNRKTWNETSGPDHLNANYRTMQFLGGVQFKNNSEDAGRVKPFAHVLAGVANQRLAGSVTSGGVTDSGSFSTNNFAMAFGGGLDIKASKRVDIRVFQFDYNPIFEKDQNTDFGTFEGRTQNNFRISVGIVIH